MYVQGSGCRVRGDLFEAMNEVVAFGEKLPDAGKGSLQSALLARQAGHFPLERHKRIGPAEAVYGFCFRLCVMVQATIYGSWFMV